VPTSRGKLYLSLEIVTEGTSRKLMMSLCDDDDGGIVEADDFMLSPAEMCRCSVADQVYSKCPTKSSTKWGPCMICLTDIFTSKIFFKMQSQLQVI
jgi:hypothetical protein